MSKVKKVNNQLKKQVKKKSKNFFLRKDVIQMFAGFIVVSLFLITVTTLIAN